MSLNIWKNVFLLVCETKLNHSIKYTTGVNCIKVPIYCYTYWNECKQTLVYSNNVAVTLLKLICMQNTGSQFYFVNIWNVIKLTQKESSY